VLHRNARLTVHGRLVLCERVVVKGWTVVAAAEAADVSRTTAYRWLRRFAEHGPAGLQDRSSRPRRMRPGVGPKTLRAIFRRRRLREGPHRISWELGVARSTVYKVLARNGQGRLRRLGPPREPVVRYEHPHPGDLVHVDTKKLGRIGQGGGKRVHGWTHAHEHRGIGWEYTHVAIDDHSRLAYAEVLPDETGITAAAFASRALAFFTSHGIQVRRLISDNAKCYGSHAFLDVLRDAGVAPYRIRPYRPQTNGKAEAFVKTLLNSWAYVRPYDNTKERTDRLGPFLEHYNTRRPHGGIGGLPPISRVPSATNVCGNYN
jgi:transposase InsO family protein